MRFTVLLLLLCGCVTATVDRTLVVTGESLRGIGTEFVQIGQVMKEGCDVTRIIEQSVCQKFRAFGEHFQKAFPLLVQLWEATRSANDIAAQQKIEAVVADLAASLSAFAVQAIAIYGRN